MCQPTSSSRRESNPRPLPYQGSALPTELREPGLSHAKDWASCRNFREHSFGTGSRQSRATFSASALRALRRRILRRFFATSRNSMERETGIEPAPSAWKAEVLPLNYSRLLRESGIENRKNQGCCSKRFPIFDSPFPAFWWREVDSNHRRRKPADLQSAPVGRLGIPPTKNAYCRHAPEDCQHYCGVFTTIGRPRRNAGRA